MNGISELKEIPETEIYIKSRNLLGIYFAAFFLALEYLTGPTAAFPVFLGNLIQSLAASAVGLLLSFVLHKLLPDKRLVFGTYLWLVLYAVASLITLLIMLRGTGAAGALFTFFGWFVAVPLVLGVAVSYLLYRRDYVPDRTAEEDVMLDMMLHGGNDVREENLEQVLGWLEKA